MKPLLCKLSISFLFPNRSNDVAKDFANYLQGKLDEFRSYNTDGIQSDWVYAYSDIPSYTTVGKSYVGINTRIQNKQV